MKRKSADEVLSASKPRDIFTMNPDTIEQEKDEYIERFKPQDYSTIKNFMATQKVILLYRQALEELEEANAREATRYSLTIRSKNGSEYEVHADYVYEAKIGKTYVTEKNVVFVISPKYKSYYENYIEKTSRFTRLDIKSWENIEHMLPKVYKHFEDENGNGIIVVTKPCKKMYPLREIWNYFGAKLSPEHVASIMTRLYNFVSYLGIIGINHNGITMDNLFFAPGRTVEEGEDYTVEDMRIVGVFGGWFFSTRDNEKLKGVPREVSEIMPEDCKKSGYSSFEVDELSIKRLARELLGDPSGKNLDGVSKIVTDWVHGEVSEPLVDWVNSNYIHKNAYEEFCAWERVRKLSFDKHRFVEMDVSID